MFLKGIISEDLEPIVENLFVIGKSQNKFPIKAILDTGFNGELALPQKDKKHYYLEPFGVKAFELANGQIVKQKIFLASLVINNKTYPVETTLTGSDIALIGMELIRGKVALFNLKTHKLRVNN